MNGMRGVSKISKTTLTRKYMNIHGIMWPMIKYTYKKHTLDSSMLIILLQFFYLNSWIFCTMHLIGRERLFMNLLCVCERKLLLGSKFYYDERKFKFGRWDGEKFDVEGFKEFKRIRNYFSLLVLRLEFSFSHPNKYLGDFYALIYMNVKFFVLTLFLFLLFFEESFLWSIYSSLFDFSKLFLAHFFQFLLSPLTGFFHEQVFPQIFLKSEVLNLHHF